MDRLARRFAETRVISITNVDMTNHLVQGRDQFGTLLQVSFQLTDTMTSIPAMGETWTVERQGNQWFLDMRGDDGSELTGLQALGPGDRRIDTSGDIYFNGNSVNVNGFPVVTGPTIPGTIITGLATSSSSTLPVINTDLVVFPAGSIHHTYTAVTTVGGAIRTVNAPTPTTSPARLMIRNAAPPVGTVTINHLLAGGTGSQMYSRTLSDIVLQSNETADFIYNGTQWIEQSRNQAIPTQAVTLICSAVAGSPQANFDTNTILGGNIPSIYNHLKILWYGASSNAVLQQNIICQFNGDTGANYNIGGGVFNSAYSNFATNGIAAAHLGSAPGSTSTAGTRGQGEAFIHGYKTTTLRKTITGTSSTPTNVDGSGQHEPRTFGSEWKNTAAITRIVANPSVGNWITGSAFYLYGIL